MNGRMACCSDREMSLFVESDELKDCPAWLQPSHVVSFCVWSGARLASCSSTILLYGSHCYATHRTYACDIPPMNRLPYVTYSRLHG